MTDISVRSSLEARALKRHAGATRRKLGVRIELEIGIGHHPLLQPP